MPLVPDRLARWLWLTHFLLWLTAAAWAAPVPGEHAESVSRVRVGVLAVLGAEAAVAEWSPLIRRLENALPGRQVSLVQLDHAGLRAAVQRGDLEFVITNPGHYVELEADLGVSRILSLDAGGGRSPQRALGAAVIVPAASAIRDLSDLRGKRLAIVGRDAFGGYQMVWGALDGLGLQPERDLAELYEVGLPMDRVVAALDAGKADAGVLRSCLLESRPEWADRFRVVAPQAAAGFPCATSTPLYPDWPLAALRHTSPDLARAVAIALLGMTRETDGLAWAVPADYQSVHELFRRLQIGPYAYLREPTLMALAARYWPWVAALALLVAAWALYTLRVEHLVHRRTAELRAAQEQAEHMARLSVLGELSGTLAHELNQPLATITNYAHSLRRRADNQRLTDAAVREAAAEIAEQAERAAGILGRIRHFARKRRNSCERLVPAEVVGESVELFRGMLARAPAVAVDDALPAGTVIEADRLQIQQVLLNLLKNAHDASEGLPDARRRIHIRLTPADAGLSPGVLIAVRDFGRGLDAAAHGRLFESFFTTKPDGLGLGLSICRSIAEAHGGRLDAAPAADGPGWVFTLNLPAVLAPATPTVLLDHDPNR